MDPYKNARMPTRNVFDLFKRCDLFYKFCSIAPRKTYNFGKISTCSHDKFPLYRRLIIKITEALVIVVNFGSRDTHYMHISRDAHAGPTFARFNVHMPAASKLAQCFLV